MQQRLRHNLTTHTAIALSKRNTLNTMNALQITKTNSHASTGQHQESETCLDASYTTNKPSVIDAKKKTFLSADREIRETGNIYLRCCSSVRHTKILQVRGRVCFGQNTRGRDRGEGRQWRETTRISWRQDVNNEAAGQSLLPNKAQESIPSKVHLYMTRKADRRCEARVSTARECGLQEC